MGEGWHASMLGCQTNPRPGVGEVDRTVGSSTGGHCARAMLLSSNGPYNTESVLGLVSWDLHVVALFQPTLPGYVTCSVKNDLIIWYLHRYYLTTSSFMVSHTNFSNKITHFKVCSVFIFQKHNLNVASCKMWTFFIERVTSHVRSGVFCSSLFLFPARFILHGLCDADTDVPGASARWWQLSGWSNLRTTMCSLCILNSCYHGKSFYRHCALYSWILFLGACISQSSVEMSPKCAQNKD